ncbi:MAG TPA: glycosyltransferase [Candidatus Methylomirabilis sp.]
MIRVTILALGSRGDVQPYLNLGEGLHRAGHRVALISFGNFRRLVEDRGLDFYPIRGDPRQILAGAAGQALASSGQNILRMWSAVMRSFGDLTRTLPSDLDLAAVRDSDVLISQLPGGIYAYDVAEKHGIRLVRAEVLPMTETSAFPMIPFPTSLSFVPGYNRLSFHLAARIMWSGFGPSINRWRKVTLGLPPWGWAGPFGRVHAEKVPVLCGFSRHVVPPPPDWGDHVHVTGYWFPGEKEWSPDEGLVQFLESGPAPVFLGFGSMPVGDPERTTALLLAAVRLSGHRAVIQAGWGGLGQASLPENVWRLGEAPYEWLFPRMSALVHHGGSGTTALGLRAGVPAVIVPFVFDQFYWGNRLAELGAGPRPIPFRRLTAERLAEAIQAAGDAGVRRRAADLGSKVRAEDGVGKAIQILEAGI